MVYELSLTHPSHPDESIAKAVVNINLEFKSKI